MELHSELGSFFICYFLVYLFFFFLQGIHAANSMFLKKMLLNWAVFWVFEGSRLQSDWKGLQQDQAVLLSVLVLTLSSLLSFTKSLKPFCSFTAAWLKIFFFILRAFSPKTEISKNEELQDSRGIVLKAAILEVNDCMSSNMLWSFSFSMFYLICAFELLGGGILALVISEYCKLQ